jgi:hypothetical protein
MRALGAAAGAGAFAAELVGAAAAPAAGAAALSSAGGADALEHATTVTALTQITAKRMFFICA